RLAAEDTFGTHLARHTSYFRRERAELIHHGVDSDLEREDFALHVDRNFARKIALGDGGGDFGDIAHLASEVARHRVDRVREILPGSGNIADFRLAAENAFRTHFAGHARDF